MKKSRVMQHLHGISEVNHVLSGPGAYSLLNLDKGQFFRTSEILDC